jgi:ribose-phosphate pyrophosphokinase
MATPRAPLALLSCDGARPLAEGVARTLGLQLARSREVWFACGEGKFVIDENVRGTDLYVFQSPVVPGDPRTVYDRFVMLLHAVEAAALSDVEWVTAVIPYFPGARQDKRKGRVREGISAGLFARMLQEAGAHRVVAVEIHNEAIAGMFDPFRCRLENVELTPRMARWLRKRNLCGDTVASPDLGGMERARTYAAALQSPLVALSKERDYTRANQVVRSTLIGDVEGCDVLLVDDMVDTAGSVVAAVDELRKHGAGNVTVACAHPVCSAPAWDRLAGLAARAEAEGWRFNFVGSSSVRHVNTPPWYHEFDIHRLLAEVISGINKRSSVTGAMSAEEAPDASDA